MRDYLVLVSLSSSIVSVLLAFATMFNTRSIRLLRHRIEALEGRP